MFSTPRCSVPGFVRGPGPPHPQKQQDRHTIQPALGKTILVTREGELEFVRYPDGTDFWVSDKADQQGVSFLNNRSCHLAVETKHIFLVEYPETIKLNDVTPEYGGNYRTYAILHCLGSHRLDDRHHEKLLDKFEETIGSRYVDKILSDEISKGILRETCTACGEGNLSNLQTFVIFKECTVLEAFKWPEDHGLMAQLEGVEEYETILCKSQNKAAKYCKQYIAKVEQRCVGHYCLKKFDSPVLHFLGCFCDKKK